MPQRSLLGRRVEYPLSADKEMKTTEAGQLVRSLRRDGQNADCPQEWQIPNSWGSGRQPRRHTTGQRMPGYSPGFKGTDARRHTPTCLQLGAKQAAAWPPASCGWAGLGVALPAPATHSTAGWDTSGLGEQSQDHGGVDTASAPHSNPTFRVAPNTETLPKTGPKKSHPVSKEDRSETGWTQLQAKPRLHSPQTSRFSAEKLQEPGPAWSFRGWNRCYRLNPVLSRGKRRQGKSPGLGTQGQGSSTAAGRPSGQFPEAQGAGLL